LLRCYDEEILIKLGIVYTKLKEFQKALTVLNVALLINPFNRDTRFYLGKAFYGKGNLDHAIKQTEKALEIEPNDPEIHFTLGLYYDKKGWHDLAVAEYQEALYLKPDYLFNKLEKLNRDKNQSSEESKTNEERENGENRQQSAGER
jgi:protein O-GlcNAc transferase